MKQPKADCNRQLLVVRCLLSGFNDTIDTNHWLNRAYKARWRSLTLQKVMAVFLHVLTILRMLSPHQTTPLHHLPSTRLLSTPKKPPLQVPVLSTQVPLLSLHHRFFWRIFSPLSIERISIKFSFCNPRRPVTSFEPINNFYFSMISLRKVSSTLFCLEVNGQK